MAYPDEYNEHLMPELQWTVAWLTMNRTIDKVPKDSRQENNQEINIGIQGYQHPRKEM